MPDVGQPADSVARSAELRRSILNIICMCASMRFPKIVDGYLQLFERGPQVQGSKPKLHKFALIKKGQMIQSTVDSAEWFQVSAFKKKMRRRRYHFTTASRTHQFIEITDTLPASGCFANNIHGMVISSPLSRQVQFLIQKPGMSSSLLCRLN